MPQNLLSASTNSAGEHVCSMFALAWSVEPTLVAFDGVVITGALFGSQTINGYKNVSAPVGE